MFISQDVFMDYKLVTPQKSDLAKAEDRSFKIVSEENVVQYYQVLDFELSSVIVNSLSSKEVSRVESDRV